MSDEPEEQQEQLLQEQQPAETDTLGVFPKAFQDWVRKNVSVGKLARLAMTRDGGAVVSNQMALQALYEAWKTLKKKDY